MSNGFIHISFGIQDVVFCELIHLSLNRSIHSRLNTQAGVE